MKKRILLGCYEIPGYGGVSTASYQLFEYLQRDGLEVCYLNLIEGRDDEYYTYRFSENYANPKNLLNVSVCALHGELLGHHPELTRAIQSHCPDILVGMGYIAALLMKQAAPNAPLIFLPSGSKHAKNSLEKHGNFQSLKNHLLRAPPTLSDVQEKKAVDLADLIIVHSDSIKFLFQHFFPNHIGKLYEEVIWRGDWIFKGASEYAFLARTFSDRDIDVLFIASSWDRPEKNFPLILDLVPHLNDIQVHLVGDCPTRIPGVTHHSLRSNRKDMFRLLGRAKTLVCPSIFDAAPGILFEASALGCNIIASKNCGNWKICHPSLLVEPLSLERMLEKIRLSLERKFPDNMDYFFSTQSYSNLLGVLNVF